MSLREELAQRLENVARLRYWQEETDQSPGPLALDLADEVIRQMEWARRECSFPPLVTWKQTEEEREALSRLSLAPPDWKP